MVFVAVLWKGHWRRPSRHELRTHTLLALLLVGGGGGLLALGQTEVSSSVAAIIMSSTPIFMLTGAFLFAGEEAPNLPQCIGMFLGGCGIVYLSWSEQSAGTGSLFGALMLLAAVATWVAGALVMKRFAIGKGMSMLESTGLILLTGGLECLLAGLCLGELQTLHWENLRTDAVLAFSWMVIGGSFIAYGSYLWLLTNVSVSLAVSYEYVAPVIGIILGYTFGGEEVTGSIVLACSVTIFSVFLVVRRKHGFRTYVRHLMIRYHCRTH